MSKKYLPKPADSLAADSSRRVISSPPIEIHLSRSGDRFECVQLKEPELIFGENRRCVDPRTGLAAFGPYVHGTSAVRGQVRIGIVGTHEAVESARSLLQEISRPIDQDPKLDSILYPSFPGLNSGVPFSVEIVTQPSWHRFISTEAQRLAEDCGDSRMKFEMFRELVGTEIRAISNLEPAPNVVICALQAESGLTPVAAACAQRLPTEILCDGKWPETSAATPDKAIQAWNLSARLLYKAGFAPWRLADAAGDTCFVGISFHRLPGSESSRTWTTCARVVPDSRQGFALKGDTFEWKSGNQEEEETPHLDQDQAADLMTRILEVYRKKVGRLPGKVVVHKTSSYGEAERMGLENSLRGVKNHALISLRRSGTLFLRPGRQPVLRGAAIPFGDKLGLVYLSGYIPFLRSYPGTQLPQPFEITENWGSLKFQEAARDLLGLTKLDWSTSAFCTDVPVTLSLPSHVWEMFGMIGHAGTALDDRYYL